MTAPVPVPDPQPIKVTRDQLLERLRDKKPTTGLWVTDPLTLKGQRHAGPLNLSGCTFAEEVDLSEGRLEGSVDLSRCTFKKSVTLADARIDGNLDLSGTTIEARYKLTDMSLTSMRAEGFPEGVVAKLGSQKDKEFATLDQILALFPVALSKAQQETLQNLVLRHAETEPANFRMVHVAADFLAQGLDSAVKIDLTGARIDGDWNWSSTFVDSQVKATVIRDDVLLVNAKVLGNVELRGALITGALNLELADVEGHIDCNPLFHPPDETDASKARLVQCSVFGEEVNLSGAKVAGQAMLEGALLGVLNGRAAPDDLPQEFCLNLQGCEIKSGFYCRSINGCRPRLVGRTWASGARLFQTIDFIGAELRGSVSLQQAVIEGPLFFQRAIRSPRSDTAADAQQWWRKHLPAFEKRGAAGLAEADWAKRFALEFAAHSTEVYGDADLNGMTLKGQAHFNGAHFGGKIGMWGAEVSGLAMFNGVRVGYPLTPPKLPAQPAAPADDRNTLSLNLDGAKVGYDLHLNGIDLKHGLSLDNAEVRGSLSCKGSQFGNVRLAVQIGGKANLKGCKVNGNVTFEGARLKAQLDMERAKIDGNLVFEPWLKDAVPKEPDDGPYELTSIQGKATLDSVEVSGRIDVSGLHAKGGLSLQGARIGWALFTRPEPTEKKLLEDLPGAVTELRQSRGDLTNHLPGVLQGSKDDLNELFQTKLVSDPVANRIWDLLRKLHVAKRPSEAAELKAWEAREKSVLEQLHYLIGLLGTSKLVPRPRIEGSGLDLRGCRMRKLTLRFEPPDAPPPSTGRAWERYFPWGLTSPPPKDLPTLNLDGCQFEELDPPGGDPSRMLDVLATAKTFQSTTYVALEKWLRDHGETTPADAVYLSMRRRRRQTMKGLLLWEYFQDITTLYGLHTWRWLGFLVILAAVNFLIFLEPNSVVPAGTAVNLAVPPAITRNWSWLNAGAITIHNLLPAWSTKTSDEYKPSQEVAKVLGLPLPWTCERTANWTTPLAATLLTIVGLGLTSLWTKPK